MYLFSQPKAVSVPAADAASPTNGKASPTTTKPVSRSAAEPRQQNAANTGTPSASINPESVYTSAAPSVLVIEVLNNAGMVASRGSAVVVGPELVVTHCHLVQYAAAVRVRAGSSEFTAMPDTADNTLDLCSLRVPGLSAPAALRSSITQVQVGQAVFAIGASQGQERLVRQGQVSALRETAGITVIQTSATISPAASGGGLFDTEGRLIGMTIYQHKLEPSQNLALPVDLLSNLRNR